MSVLCNLLSCNYEKFIDNEGFARYPIQEWTLKLILMMVERPYLCYLQALLHVALKFLFVGKEKKYF